ncbi:MAG: hypothetical protein K9N09_07345 [Candidatus Cloacimonetes bacterium]|nr:hypothetical protein [Candidatus Cloacimonadota bacterium]MCF7813817.1 hypothetical protein [Candidatus Cloacimonadota bacterium]MCF7868496.1 hypothetical protein [Candidatus Cloacimonadota bacterium]
MAQTDLTYLESDLRSIIESIMKLGANNNNYDLLEIIISDIDVLNSTLTDQNTKSDFDYLLEDISFDHLEKIIKKIKHTNLKKTDNDFNNNLLDAFKIVYLLIGKIFFSESK